METKKLEEIIKNHVAWLNNQGGNRADLREANLWEADLREANLWGANLWGANLRGANLWGANLWGANLRGANLQGANLWGANLRGANLRGANLRGANLQGAYTDYSTAFFEIQCPEEGSFIGWKKARGKLIKLLIMEDAKRSSATTYKCRASKVKCLEIEGGARKICSDWDYNFKYEVGKIIEVPDFDEDRWNECSTGIHFFLNKSHALRY